MSITPLPSAPAVTDTTSEFNTKAFNWVAALDPFTTEANALLATCEDAAGTASAAIALVGAEAWVSGTTYAIGDSVYSPIDMQTYRRKTNGGGTTDPSADSTNWEKIAFNATLATQAEMEAGTETAIRAVSPLRVKQAIEALTPPPTIRTKVWTAITSTGSYTVPSGVTSIRVYAVGGGGSGGVFTTTGTGSGSPGGGGGGGMAYGDIAVRPGQTVSVSISSGVATVTYGGTTLLTANPGNNASNGSGSSAGTGGSGGTATKHASVTNGGAYTGGSGGNGYYSASYSYSNGSGGGGSAASPLGNGYAGGNGNVYTSTTGPGAGGGGIGGVGGSPSFFGGTPGGGGGAGGAGSTGSGGGAGGPSAGGINAISIGRSIATQFTDPLLVNAVFGSLASYYGSASTPVIAQTLSGAGGSVSYSSTSLIANGGDFGGGAGAGVSASIYVVGKGGILGGGGGSGRICNVAGGDGGYGGGGGGGGINSAGDTPTAAGSGGSAIILIYA